MLKTWGDRFKNIRLSQKMILVYLVVMGAVCVIAMVGLQISLRIYDEELYEKSQQELDFFAQRVNRELEELEALSMSVATDTDIQEQLAYMGTLKYLSSEYGIERQELRKIIMDKIITHSTVKNVIYTDGRSVQFLVGTECGQIDDTVFEYLLEQFDQARGGYFSYAPTESYPYLLSGRDILEKKNATLRYMGSLIFTSDVSGILKTQKKKLNQEYSKLFVYSENGMIYQDADPVDLELPAPDCTRGYQITEYDGEKSFLCYEKSADTGWVYVNIFPYSEIYGRFTVLRYALFGGFAAVFLIAAAFIRKVARTITGPLEQLSESMKIVEHGDFQGARSVIVQSGRKDETGLLTQEFIVMLEQIDLLINENYKSQLLLQQTKYRMLRAQINPHFLYNTLNTINWMIRAGQNQDASKMIVELGKLLRVSFAQDSYTTVAEEVGMAKSYMAIQQFRYKSRADFVIETQGNLENYTMPRMVLQPLIENAILYGVEKSLQPCRIVVRVHEKEEYILLQVEDEGPGMTEEKLEKLRAFAVEPHGHGIGMKNIRERLDFAYENSEFLIYSQVGKGTRIEIKLPKLRKEDRDVQTADCR